MPYPPPTPLLSAPGRWRYSRGEGCRLAEFSEAGITATTVSRMDQAGEVVRGARGLYQLTDAALDAQQSLAEAARLVPKGVICPASAVAFHSLTGQMPLKVWSSGCRNLSGSDLKSSIGLLR